MATFNFIQMEKIEKEIKSLRDDISQNLQSLENEYSPQNATTIYTLIKTYYDKLQDSSFLDESGSNEFYLDKFLIILCSLRIKNKDKLSLNEIKSVLLNIKSIENSLHEIAEDDIQEALDHHNEIIVSYVPMIYLEYCRIMYSVQNYNEIITYGNKLITLIKNADKNIINNTFDNNLQSKSYMYMAEACFFNNSSENDFSYYDEAIHIDSKNIEAYIKKANAFYKIRKYSDAADVYKKVLLMKDVISKPILLDIYHRLCRTYIKLEDSKNANNIISQLEHIINDKNTILPLKARVLDLEKKYNESYLLYEEVLKTDNDPINKIRMGVSASKANMENGNNLIEDGIESILKDLAQNVEICNNFYIYRPINERTLANIQSQYLSFSSPEDFNDPLDSSFCIESIKEQSIKNCLKNIKIRCFSDGGSDPLNTLMWSHYAKDHTGISIEYGFTKEFKENINKNFYFYRVKYSNNIIDNMNIMTFKDHLRAFYTKAEQWKYENECRLITFRKNLTDGYRLNDAVQIKSITFGYKTSDEYITLIKSLLNNNNCVFYKVVTPDIAKSPFKLSREEC